MLSSGLSAIEASISGHDRYEMNKSINLLREN